MRQMHPCRDCGKSIRLAHTRCRACAIQAGICLSVDMSPAGVAARFWAKVKKGDGCWEWQGALIKGYGSFRTVTHWYAHRWSYQQAVGAIPDGLQLDHLCRNPRCVRPDHLEPVTGGENVRRGHTARGCSRGHKFTEENTYYRPDRPWQRQCRACIRLRTARAARRYALAKGIERRERAALAVAES